MTFRREVGNIHNLHAVDILHANDVVGHVPHTISTPYNVRIYKEGGVITCMILNHRQYSVDLEQGGLNIPCKPQFYVGLFSIAVATALAFECDPSKLEFVKSEMLNCLITCFEEGTTSMYPVK